MINKIVLAFALVFVFISCKENDLAIEPNASIHASELLTHQLINIERGKLQLSQMEYDDNIAAIARSHSEAMANGSVPFSHDGSDDRVRSIKALYTVISVGENVAYNFGYKTPEKKAVDDWMNSPGHRANIVGEYNRTGIGIAISADGKYYFTQLFANIKTGSIL